jgi:hypothetical protein
VVHILIQINPVHTTPSCFSRMNPNIILAPTTRSSGCYILCPSHHPSLHHFPNPTWYL